MVKHVISNAGYHERCSAKLSQIIGVKPPTTAARPYPNPPPRARTLVGKREFTNSMPGTTKKELKIGSSTPTTRKATMLAPVWCSASAAMSALAPHVCMRIRNVGKVKMAAKIFPRIIDAVAPNPSPKAEHGKVISSCTILDVPVIIRAAVGENPAFLDNQLER